MYCECGKVLEKGKNYKCCGKYFHPDCYEKHYDKHHRNEKISVSIQKERLTVDFKKVTGIAIPHTTDKIVKKLLGD